MILDVIVLKTKKNNKNSNNKNNCAKGFLIFLYKTSSKLNNLPTNFQDKAIFITKMSES